MQVRFHLAKVLNALWPLCVLTLAVLVVAWLNIKPGTFLTGWDNLHPEFDYKTNWLRAWSGVWQEYQGLGVVAGNGHATELLRIPLVAFLDLFLPKWLVRYSYHLLMWWLGGVGIFVLLKHQFFSRFKSGQIRAMGSLLGALFYLLNLGTVQNFYAPYEAFSHHYAFMPWLLLVLFRFLKKPNTKTLSLLALTNLLATPMAYIPTIFIVYLFVLGIVWFGWIAKEKSWQSVKSVFLSGIIIFIVNSYWLLPFGYFVSRGTEFVSQTTINKMFTEEAFLRNKQYGQLTDVMMLRGFWFSNTDVIDNFGKHDFMMRPWMNHLENPFVRISLYGFFGLICLGFFETWRKSYAGSKTLLAITLLGMFALLNDNWPTGFIFRSIQEAVPLFKQVFRFPYTKFVVITSLGYSVFFAMGFSGLIKAYSKFSQKTAKTASIGLAVFFSIVLVWSQLPAFQGNFFYQKLQTIIPSEYFDVFDYFQNHSQVKGKVAYLPQPTYWGWLTYGWGYRGSGFPWYGTPQPILDRAFDVWSLENEGYYWELDHALYESADPQVLENVLAKYGVEFIWHDALNSLVKNGEYESVFTSGKQSLYRRVDPDTVLTEVRDAPDVQANAQRIKWDSAYHLWGDYITSSKPDISMPFADLDAKLPNWKVVSSEDALTLSTTIEKAGALENSQAGQEGWYSVNFEGGKLIISKQTPQLANSSRTFSLNSKLLSSQFFAETINDNTLFQLGNRLFASFQLPTRVFWKEPPQSIPYFESSAQLTEDVSSRLFELPIYDCVSGLIQFEDVNRKQLSLKALKEKTCVYNRLSDLLAENYSNSNFGVNRITLRFRASENAKIVTCLTREGEMNCERQASSYYDGSGEWITHTWEVNAAHITTQQYWLKIELTSTDLLEAKADVQNVSVQVVDLSSSQLAQLEGFDEASESRLPETVTPGSLGLRIDRNSGKLINLVDLEKEPYNCFEHGNGTYNREVLTQNNESFVRYSSQDASSCETIHLESDNFSGMLVAITSRNIVGRPVKICLRHDPPGNCSVTDLLPDVKDAWVTTYYVVPPLSRASTDVFLEIDTLSIGKENRVNDISSIEMYPIDYNFIKSIQTQNVTSQFGELLRKTNESESDISRATTVPLEFNSSAIFSYHSQFKHGSVASSMRSVSLMQGFDEGWLGYAVDGAKCGVGCRLMPWWFGERLEHVKVNGWANGWMVASDERGTTSDDNTLNIVILFWPQYLEWAGLLALSGFGLWLGVGLVKERKNKKHN
jgi:hypothetical protein